MQPDAIPHSTQLINRIVLGVILGAAVVFYLNSQDVPSGA